MASGGEEDVPPTGDDDSVQCLSGLLKNVSIPAIPWYHSLMTAVNQTRFSLLRFSTGFAILIKQDWKGELYADFGN